MFTFSSDTPDWINDWVTWSANLLIPNWDVWVTMVDDLAPDEPDDKGEVEAYSQYMRAFIRYEKELKDDKEGRERVVHEVIHALLDDMGAAAENLITSKRIQKNCWSRYIEAEETAVVFLSRLLVSLRGERSVEK